MRKEGSWFQFRLSTAVVLVLEAGALLGLNFIPNEELYTPLGYETYPGRDFSVEDEWCDMNRGWGMPFVAMEQTEDYAYLCPRHKFPTVFALDANGQRIHNPNSEVGRFYWHPWGVAGNFLFIVGTVAITGFFIEAANRMVEAAAERGRTSLPSMKSDKA